MANKDNLATVLFKTINDIEGCGICEKEGAEVFWPNHRSFCAHQECFNLIQPTEREFMNFIEKSTQNNYAMNMAHSEAVRKVREKCGKTLIEFYMEYGGEILRELFSTVGICAAQSYLENEN